MIDTNHPYPLPSHTRFGWFLTFVLAVAALFCYLVLASGDAWSLGLAVAALICAVMTVVQPKLLAPLNKAWYLLGDLLGKIISPIVLGVIFFLIITPVAFVGRLMGRDELRLRRQALRSQPTYWIDRKSPSPKGDSFHNQF
jgi:hypothetical protein